MKDWINDKTVNTVADLLRKLTRAYANHDKKTVDDINSQLDYLKIMNEIN